MPPLTMSLEETVNERVSFLREQIDPENKPIVNETFQLQIDVLQNADRERIALLMLQKKKQLEIAHTIHESDRLFTELEALEWLQRQIVKNP
jgi:propanediol dehydratase small subunit